MLGFHVIYNIYLKYDLDSVHKSVLDVMLDIYRPISCDDDDDVGPLVLPCI